MFGEAFVFTSLIYGKTREHLNVSADSKHTHTHDVHIMSSLNKIKVHSLLQVQNLSSKHAIQNSMASGGTTGSTRGSQNAARGPSGGPLIIHTPVQYFHSCLLKTTAPSFTERC